MTTLSVIGSGPRSALHSIRPLASVPLSRSSLHATLVGVPDASPAPVRDLKARLILSPLFGVAIPSLSGLVDSMRHSTIGLAASYAYFAGCAFLIWSGNRALYLRLPHRDDWLERPWRRITILLVAIGLFTIPVSWLMLVGWQRITGDPGQRPFAVLTAILAIVSVVVIITHAYETVFLLRDWESARLKAARLDHARLQAKLDALTREVDPHFLFNSLHALAHLVERKDPTRRDVHRGARRMPIDTY